MPKLSFYLFIILSFLANESNLLAKNIKKPNKNNNINRNRSKENLELPEFPKNYKSTVIDKKLLDSPVYNKVEQENDHGRDYDKFYLEPESRFFYKNFQRGSDEMIHLEDKIYANTENTIYGYDYPTTYRSRVLAPTTISFSKEEMINQEDITSLYYKK